METITGHVTGINSNMANVSFDGAVRKNEVGYILVDGKRLKGEVIRINNGIASMQIYEMSNGIKVGDPVEFTGELMSVDLGPGLLTQIYDGLQNPLPELAEQLKNDMPYFGYGYIKDRAELVPYIPVKPLTAIPHKLVHR